MINREYRNSLMAAMMLSLPLCGCIPATTTVVPQISGRVVDATGKPVANAEVCISLAKETSAPLLRKCTTDQSGKFRHEEETQWCIAPILPLDAIAPEFVAAATHNGVRSSPKEFGGGIWNFHFLGLGDKTACIDLGDILVDERH
jgi:hypothetical protein